MHPNILAQRNAQALGRLVQAAATLAARHGVDVPGLTPTVRDPQAAALFQREAIADFLEELVARADSSPNTPPGSRRRSPEPVA